MNVPDSAVDLAQPLERRGWKNFFLKQVDLWRTVE
jgi:hypothetical protein